MLRPPPLEELYDWRPLRHGRGIGSSVDLGRLAVLVVDDNRFDRELLRSALIAHGLRKVAGLEDAGEALRRLEAVPADLVLVDYAMPVMSGVEFTRRIRWGWKGIDPRLPVIVVSGYSDLDVVRAARDAGVHDFVTKPFSPATLVRRIAAAVASPRPFVMTDSYRGPDRRWVDRGHGAGAERRG